MSQTLRFETADYSKRSEIITDLASLHRRRVVIHTSSMFATVLYRKNLSSLGKRLKVGTFQRLCSEIYKDRNICNPVFVEDEGTKLAWILEALKLLPSPPPYTDLREILKFITQQQTNFISPEFSDKRHPFTCIYQAYRDLLTDTNHIDIEDTLLLMYRRFKLDTWLASLYNRNYCTICIDDASLMSRAEELFLESLLASNEHLHLVYFTKP